MGFKKINIILVFLFFFDTVLVPSVFVTSVFADSDQKIQEQKYNGQKDKDRIQITIKKTNFVKKSHIFLKDIAKVQATDFFKEALDNLELGRSPSPGQVKLFGKNKILSIIQNQRYLPENIDIISPQQIYVKRLSQEISKITIRQFVGKELLKIFKDKEYQLKAFNIRGLEQYPQGDIKLQFDSKKIINDGKLSCYINVIIDGEKEDRVKISGHVAVYENLFFATKHLIKGDIFSKNCVYQEKKNIYDVRDGFVKKIEDLDGKMVKSSIRKGDYIRTGDFERPPLIKKGDIIKLVVKNSNLLIVASGVSMENGYENELIKVENLGSGKFVRGVVKAKSKVEVIY
jgi:flagellar basal body P-ring formation protein FlgA